MEILSKVEDFAPPRVEEEIAPKPVNMCILSEEENHLQNHGDEDAQRAASDAVVASSLAELTLAQESPESLRAVEISLVHSNLKETNPFEGFSTNEAHLPKNLHSPIAPIRPPNDKHDQTTGLPKLVLTKRNFVPSPYTQTHTSTISLLPPAHTSTKAHTHTHTHKRNRVLLPCLCWNLSQSARDRPLFEDSKPCSKFSLASKAGSLTRAPQAAKVCDHSRTICSSKYNYAMS